MGHGTTGQYDGRHAMTRRKRQFGQAMPEYLLACGVLIVVLLLPWNGEASVLAQLMSALRGYLRMAIFLLSLI